MTTSTDQPALHRLRPAELALYHRNPRLGDVAAIAASLRAHDQYKPIVVNRGTHTGRPMEVLAGNHTLKAIRDLAETHPDDERWHAVLCHVIDVDDDRAARIVVADNRTSELGTMDDAELYGLLQDMDGNLDGLGFTDADFADLAAALDTDPPGPEDGEDGNTGIDYTNSVNVPHYEPSGTPPELPDLLDDTRTQELVAHIDAADVPEDVKVVLRAAAQRHTVIDFHRMADYYAHAPAEVQALMEQQALVIIDVDDAIRHGYLRLSETMKAIFDKDQADAHARGVF